MLYCNQKDGSLGWTVVPQNGFSCRKRRTEPFRYGYFFLFSFISNQKQSDNADNHKRILKQFRICNVCNYKYHLLYGGTTMPPQLITQRILYHCLRLMSITISYYFLLFLLFLLFLSLSAKFGFCLR